MRLKNIWSSCRVPERFQILSGAALKWIAMISMLFDHANKGILLNLIIVKGVQTPALLWLSDVLEVLGRIAFPIFLFLLVEGFHYTRSRWKYFLSLVGFGVLAEVPFDMFLFGTPVDRGGQNMFFTLALALLTLWMVDWLRERRGRMGTVLSIPAVLIMCYLASWLSVDYGYYGILIPVIFYFLREYRLVGSVLSYLVVIKELWSVLGFGLVNLYSGERGRINKWLCYGFYPAHLLVIGIIRVFWLKV